jgi:hypothetical protein
VAIRPMRGGRQTDAMPYCARTDERFARREGVFQPLDERTGAV